MAPEVPIRAALLMQCDLVLAVLVVGDRGSYAYAAINAEPAVLMQVADLASRTPVENRDIFLLPGDCKKSPRTPET